MEAAELGEGSDRIGRMTELDDRIRDIGLAVLFPYVLWAVMA